MSISPFILIVDDELRMCASLEALLKMNDYEISTANCGQAAMALLNNMIFDLAILDVNLPDMMGHAILNHIQSQSPDTPVIVITGDADLDSALSALRSGAYDYLRKPFEFDELLKTVENALAQRVLKREKETLDRELNLSEEKYRYLVQNSPDIIYTLDADGNFTFLSSAVEHLLGFTPNDLIGKHYSTIVCEEDRKKATWHVNERRRKNRATSGLELRLKLTGQALRHTRKADFLTVELKSMGIYDPSMTDEENRHVGTHGVIRDISQRKRLQAQLQNAERMDSLGTLAGGIAHDFNNLLMGIQGRSSLISMDLDELHPHMEHLCAINEYIRSASELTNQLLGFARGGKYEVKPTDINELVLKTGTMFGRTKKEVSIHTQFRNKTIVVESDQRQLEQVLINLYVNAWQAMPNGGDLFLGTKIVVLDSDFCAPYQLEPGPYAHVSVTDTGIGMGRKTLRRIFDPFFTTKEKGKGTGLGLASAYGIIKNHDGIITAYSEEGCGTTFNIYLPMSDKMAVSDIPTDNKIIKGTETVLLVDDEDMILEVGQALLERLGYRVVAVKSGEDAVEAVQRMGSKIDLVLLDMIMPGMSGGEAFDRIREIRPLMRVILSSGYTIDGQARLIMQRGCNGFIQKPFDVADLSNKLHQVINSYE